MTLCAELALGYGGSVGALKSMGALKMGIPEEELQPLVDSWRPANPNIVRFWWDVDRAVKKAVKNSEPSVLKGIRFERKSHVHDELIIECNMGVDLGVLCEQMGRTPLWADGLILRADGYETPFYKKD